MSGRLYRRAATLTLAKPAVTQRGGRFGAFFAQQPNAVVIGSPTDASGGLRFAFTVTKSLEPEPNPAEITVWNLSETSKATLQVKPLHVRLDVAYDGADLQRLFVGDLRWAEARTEGPDKPLTLTCGDGERAFRHARVNRSFKPGATRGQALNDVTAALGLDSPGILAAVPGLGDTFPGGLSMTGPAHREMTRLLEPTGADWSIQDGRLQVLAAGGVRNDRAVLVRQDTGMLGTPEYGPPTEAGKPPVLSVKMLLYPGLTPGGLIQVESQGINGGRPSLFKMVRIVHTGDTHGAEWSSTIEATAR